ncbi:MAG: DUF4175 family protein, partial [Pseudomonadota bacterium]|nr:DUF4175 family protein [Pseudomonadota bacterium]
MPLADRLLLFLKLTAAAAAMTFERLVHALGPTAVLLALALALALTNAPAHLPGWLHLLAMLLFVGGFVWLTGQGFSRWRRPARDEIWRRLDRDQGREHRPVEIIKDRLPNESRDPMARVLWQRHLMRFRVPVRGMVRMSRTGT